MKKPFKVLLIITMTILMTISQLGLLAACNGGTKSKILREKYADYFKVGFAINYELLNLPEYQEIYKHFNSMTAENEMKWAYLRPNAYQTSYQKADAFIKKAKELNIGMRGHALVWHHTSAVPYYINSSISKNSFLTYIKEHVDTTIKHFGDEVIYAWDVVNEAITDNDNSASIYRRSGDGSGGASFFYDIAGEDYIFTAFRQAQETVEENNLNIKLFYNDYNMNNQAKRSRAIQMIRNIRAQGIRVDGIGMQAHYNIHTYKESEFKKAIEDFIAEGLEIHITELDVSVHKDNNSRFETLSSELEEAQARVFKSIYKICREFSEHVTSVTTWGVADDHTWLDNFPVSNRKNWPLLFSETYEPKKGFEAIMDFTS